ncbi:hypothetical protein Scep_001244 [Stephania cephalantha]|uniref:Uncharacterized protein n=1 Tax=Stephania cephalantha TaxID=152367 RepID=A0AAP0L8Z0_9MAGN
MASTKRTRWIGGRDQLRQRRRLLSSPRDYEIRWRLGPVEGETMAGFGQREEATGRDLARETWGCRPAVEKEERELTEQRSKEQAWPAAIVA